MISPVRYSGFGQNYGVVQAFVNPLNTASVQSDLNDMWRDGVRRIRLWLPNYTSDASYAVANIITIGDMAKAMGFYVKFGGSSVGSTLNDTFFTTVYTPAVIARITVAQAHGFDEFFVDNEAFARATTGGLTNFFTKYPALFVSCRGTGFTGKITYAESENTISSFTGQTVTSSGTFPVDYLAMNSYGGGVIESGRRFFLLNCGICFVNFGVNSYLSETNIYTSNPYVGLTAKQIYEGCKFKVDKAFEIGFPFCDFFSFSSPSDQFSVKNADGSYRRNRQAFTRVRRNSAAIVT